MYAQWIALLMTNFALVMFVLAICFVLIHKLLRSRVPDAEIIYRWFAFFALGCTSIYAAIMHAFFPLISAAAIGWAPSPFQFEVAVADLGIGVLGVLSFKASYGFRLATVIASVCLFWGDAIGHGYQMISAGNFSVGNAGSWFWLDVLVPLILVLCMLKLNRRPHYFI